MHYVLYAVGGLSLVASAFAFFIGLTDGRSQLMMMGGIGALGAVLWLGIGRGLELLETITAAVAPKKDEEITDPSRLERPAPRERMTRGGI